MPGNIEELLIRIKKKKPMILSITKYFAMDFIANGLRSIGALPIMSNAEQEVEELLQFASCVVINLGKLDDQFVRFCEYICRAANQSKKPIILNPVGAGATRYRTEVALKLINDHRIAVVHGFENEISGLLNPSQTILNDGSIKSEVAFEDAKSLATKYNLAVVMTGKQNTVIDAGTIRKFDFDSEYLLKIAGGNGLLSSIIGVFHAVEDDRLKAALAAVHYYGICVDYSAEKASGPGSFKVKLIDALYRNSSESI